LLVAAPLAATVIMGAYSMWRNLEADDYAWLLGNSAVVLVIIFLLLKAAGVRFLDDGGIVPPKKRGE
jgi:drug/metabolite transporter superfamily protein YnfA